MLYGGIDWGDKTLDYELHTLDDRVLAQGQVTATFQGVQDLFVALERHALPDQICLAIETKHGAWMQSLLDRGYTICPVNPKTVERFRQACSANGDKSDRIDRKVLATYMVTFRNTLRPLKPDAPEIVSLRIACEDRVRRVQERTGKSNELTSTLKAYYPAFVGLFGDLDSEIALRFLLDFPTQNAMRKLTPSRLEHWLRKQHYTCMHRLPQMCAHLQAEALVVAEHLQQAKVRTIRYLANALLLLREEIAQREEEITEAFGRLPEAHWARSVPGAGKNLGPAIAACLGRDTNRFETTGQARAFFGTAPVTRTSGQSRQVFFRRGCWKFARRTLQLLADVCRVDCPWAAELYDRLRAAGRKHHQALRVVAHKWVPILLALQRTDTPYNEAIYQQSRQQYLSNAKPADK
jgi:transposase